MARTRTSVHHSVYGVVAGGGVRGHFGQEDVLTFSHATITDQTRGHEAALGVAERLGAVNNTLRPDEDELGLPKVEA